MWRGGDRFTDLNNYFTIHYSLASIIYLIRIRIERDLWVYVVYVRTHTSHNRINSSSSSSSSSSHHHCVPLLLFLFFSSCRQRILLAIRETECPASGNTYISQSAKRSCLPSSVLRLRLFFRGRHASLVYFVCVWFVVQRFLDFFLFSLSR